MTNISKLPFLLLSIFAIIILAEPVFAATTYKPTQIDQTMCTVVTMLTGTIGKAIAIFAIIFIGVSLFMGKVSWGLAISTAIGIGAIFGAAGIVDTLSGKAKGNPNCTQMKGRTTCTQANSAADWSCT
jgi:type IV secretory pathway VirB2 component (pilin)